MGESPRQSRTALVQVEFPTFNTLVREWVVGEASELGADADQALGEEASPTAAAAELAAAADHLFDFSPVGAWEGKSLLQQTMPAIRHTAEQFQRLEAQVCGGLYCARAPIVSSVSLRVSVTPCVLCERSTLLASTTGFKKSHEIGIPNWNGRTHNNVVKFLCPSPGQPKFGGASAPRLEVDINH